jgi:hypothetical protein
VNLEVWTIRNGKWYQWCPISAIQCLFDELAMFLRDLELLLVDWILHFEVDFVLEILG